MGEGSSLVLREIQPTMDKIQQLMLHEWSSFEQHRDWIVQAQNYSIQAREATDAAIDQYFKGLRSELIAKVTKLDQQLVKLFIGNWYDRLGAKLADARPPPDNKDNIRSWLCECHAKINQTRTSVFDPHRLNEEMPGQGTSAGHQRQSAGAIVAGAGIVLDLGFQVYNACELHSLKKKVKKLRNIVSTVASEEVVLHNDITALARVTNHAVAKLTSSIKRLETLLNGTVDTLFRAMQQLQQLAARVEAMEQHKYIHHVIDATIMLYLFKYVWLQDVMVQQVSTLRCAAEQLHQGQLPAQLVMETSLQRVLNQLQTKLKESAAKPDFVFTDARDYYELPGVEATMVKGQLIIQIPVMLHSEDQDPAVLHMVDRVWVPVTNKTGLYTRVRSLPEFLAVMASGEVTEVSQHKLTKCATVQSVWLCPFLRWASGNSCAATIYNNDE